MSELPDQPALNPYVTDTALIVHVDGETNHRADAPASMRATPVWAE